MLRASWMIPEKNSQTGSFWLLSVQDKCILNILSWSVGGVTWMNICLIVVQALFLLRRFLSLSRGLGSDDLLDVRE